MATVQFVDCSNRVLLPALAPTGGSLLDVCDDHRAPVPFECRDARCGACRVAVVSGARHLASPEAEELELLSALDSAGRVRLACRARLLPGSGTVRLKVVPR
jgi:2Fe-2S ferredoxin